MTWEWRIFEPVLVIHTFAGVGALAVSLHLWIALRRAATRRRDRYLAGRYASLLGWLIAATILSGALAYPAFRVGVRAAWMDTTQPGMTALFEIKEHWGTILLVLAWATRRRLLPFYRSREPRNPPPSFWRFQRGFAALLVAVLAFSCIAGLWLVMQGRVSIPDPLESEKKHASYRNPKGCCPEIITSSCGSLGRALAGIELCPDLLRLASPRLALALLPAGAPGLQLDTAGGRSGHGLVQPSDLRFFGELLARPLGTAAVCRPPSLGGTGSDDDDLDLPAVHRRLGASSLVAESHRKVPRSAEDQTRREGPHLPRRAFPRAPDEVDGTTYEAKLPARDKLLIYLPKSTHMLGSPCESDLDVRPVREQRVRFTP